jgi:16S rRNA (guanine527-N7)-methyltransferase
MSDDGPRDGVATAAGLSPEEVLRRGLAELGIGGRETLISPLLRYVAEVERWNPALGLVKASGTDLVVRHVLDSLAGAPAFGLLPAGAVVLDVGSGAGFPGVPLALALPELRFVLLDRMSRRCTFLEHCVAVLTLGNAAVRVGDAKDYREPVDAVTFRAVSALTADFLLGTGIAGKAPLVVAYKGTLERSREEAAAVSDLFASVEVIPLRVPFLVGERALVVLRR